MTETLDILSKSQLFGGLPPEHLAEIRRIAVEKHFDKGEIIFLDGDEGGGFFLVIAGLVKVFKLSPEGKEQILHIVAAGETIGAVPVFSGQSFPANAQAIAQCRALFFPRQEFIGLISANPALTMNILAVLSMRLREFTVQIENLALKEIPSRLAAYLLDQAEAQGGGDLISLQISKAQVSNILGTGPESLSRALAALKQRKLIEVDGLNITLLDREGLTQLASGGKPGNGD